MERKPYSREAQESAFRDRLQQIGLGILSDEDLIVLPSGNSGLHNRIFISFNRKKQKRVNELNGIVEGRVLARSSDKYDYEIKTVINYFDTSERVVHHHSTNINVSGVNVTEPNLSGAFRYYVSNIVLGQVGFFDRGAG